MQVYSSEFTFRNQIRIYFISAEMSMGRPRKTETTWLAGQAGKL